LFLQRLAIGEHRFFELRRATLAVPEGPQHSAQIVLGYGPVERYTLASSFLQRLAIGDDGLFELRRATLAVPEGPQRIAQFVLRHGPFERHTLAGRHLDQPFEPPD
jgi:hypothetical protein